MSIWAVAPPEVDEVQINKFRMSNTYSCNDVFVLTFKGVTRQLFRQFRSEFSFYQFNQLQWQYLSNFE